MVMVKRDGLGAVAAVNFALIAHNPFAAIQVTAASATLRFPAIEVCLVFTQGCRIWAKAASGSLGGVGGTMCPSSMAETVQKSLAYLAVKSTGAQ